MTRTDILHRGMPIARSTAQRTFSHTLSFGKMLVTWKLRARPARLIAAAPASALDLVGLDVEEDGIGLEAGAGREQAVEEGGPGELEGEEEEGAEKYKQTCVEEARSLGDVRTDTCPMSDVFDLVLRQ